MIYGYCYSDLKDRASINMQEKEIKNIPFFEAGESIIYTDTGEHAMLAGLLHEVAPGDMVITTKFSNFAEDIRTAINRLQMLVGNNVDVYVVSTGKMYQHDYALDAIKKICGAMSSDIFLGALSDFQKNTYTGTKNAKRKTTGIRYPEKTKEMVLSLVKDYTYSEIANLTGICISTISKFVNNAIKQGRTVEKKSDKKLPGNRKDNAGHEKQPPAREPMTSCTPAGTTVTDAREDTGIKDIRMEAYRLYQLDWMQRHGYSVYDIIKETYSHMGNNGMASQADCIGMFEETGINNSLYSCYNEFIDNEYQETDYIHELFDISGDAKDLKEKYDKDIEGMHNEEQDILHIKDELKELRATLSSYQSLYTKPEGSFNGMFDAVFADIVNLMQSIYDVI